MLKYVCRPYINPKSAYNGRFYAHPAIEETVDLKALAKHMSGHNSGFGEAVCYGVVQTMVKCIKEMVLDGKNVKIDDLAIFSCGIVNASGGSATVKDFTTARNIRRVKLRARATGELSNTSLNLEASLKKAYYTTSGAIVTDPDDQPVTPDGSGGSSGGSGNDGNTDDNPLG